MSEHDPFDGLDDAPVPAQRVESPKSDDAPVTRNDEGTTLYDSASSHAEPGEKPSQDIRPAVDTVYSTPFLRRQSKGDLQKIAKDKGLDTSGGRDDLVERIEADQRS